MEAAVGSVGFEVLDWFRLSGRTLLMSLSCGKLDNDPNDDEIPDVVTHIIKVPRFLVWGTG